MLLHTRACKDGPFSTSTNFKLDILLCISMSPRLYAMAKPNIWFDKAEKNPSKLFFLWYVILVVNTENNEKCMLFYKSQVSQDNSWLRAPPMCMWTGKDKLQYGLICTLGKPKRNQSGECKEREPEKPFLHLFNSTGSHKSNGTPQPCISHKLFTKIYDITYVANI
jgi:hypothetical protein